MKNTLKAALNKFIRFIKNLFSKKPDKPTYTVFWPIGDDQKYAPEALSNALANYQNKIKAGIAFGCIKSSPDEDVSLAEASHKITAARLMPDGKNVMVDLKVLDTPAGKDLERIMSIGSNISVGARGFGKVEANIVKDLTIQSFSITSKIN